MERPSAQQIVTAKKKLNEVVSDMSYRKGQAESATSFDVIVPLHEFSRYIKEASKAVEYFDVWLEER